MYFKMRSVYCFLNYRTTLFFFVVVIQMSIGEARGQEPPTFTGVPCTIGPKYPVVDAQEKFYFSKGNDIVSVKINKDMINFQKYDGASLQQLSSKAAEGLPQGSEFEGFVEIKGKLHFFYAVWDEKDDTVKLYSRVVDFQKGNLASEEQYYLTANNEITGTRRKHNMYPIGTVANDFFDLYHSQDSTKLLIQYGKLAEKKGEKKNQQISCMAVFDFTGEVKKLWSREVTWPFDVSKVINPDYCIDNQGNVYSAAWLIYDEKEQKKQKEEGREFFSELLVLKETAVPSPDPVMAKIDITGKRATDASIYIGADGRITLSGYYLYSAAADFYYDDAHGVFNCIIGNDGTVQQKNFADIPEELSDLYYDKKARKTEKPVPPGLGRLKKKKLNAYSDGSILLGEQYFEQVMEYNNPNYSSSSSMNSNATTQSTEYRFRNIIVAKFNTEGNLAWINKLKKYQRAGMGCNSVSYRMIETGNEIYFFFLDNLKNLTPGSEQEEPYIDGRKGYLAVYRLNKLTGKNDKIPLFDFGNVNGMILHQVAPFRIVQTSAEEFVMEAYTGEKEDVLVKYKMPQF